MRVNEIMSTAEAIQRLQKIADLNTGALGCIAREPLGPKNAHLVAVGLVSARSLKIGPLALPANEAHLQLTDAGKEFLEQAT